MVSAPRDPSHECLLHSGVNESITVAEGDKNQILEMNYTHLGTHAGGYCKALCEKIRSQA